MILIKKLLLAILITTLFLSCSNEKTHTGIEMSGTWKAIWSLTDDNFRSFFTSDQMNMQGELTFMEGHLVRIKAYGFKGCAFTPDTTENLLHYSFNDSLFNFINQSDEVIFSYVVRERQQDFIRLLLMDDIQLTLTKM